MKDLIEDLKKRNTPGPLLEIGNLGPPI